MNSQTTLLTAHKGVDLHAATAVRVMRDRLEGGDRLRSLHRCGLHTFRGEPGGVSVARLLDTGRYFNPNKHHYGHFEFAGSACCDDPDVKEMPSAWPGELRGSDLQALVDDPAALYDALLGGPVPTGCTAVDAAAWARDQDGPVTSGVLWRLVLTGDPADAGEVAETLLVARGRKEGLLVNPHMEAWQLTVR